MKLSLLAKSCLCPGLVVLVANLIKSSADPPDSLLRRSGKDWEWLKEYWNGKKYEIYKVPLSPAYANKQFCMIASDVYKDLGLLLFGLEISVMNEQHGTILLNPGRYKLPKPVNKNVWYNYWGYVIASDEA